jgi:PAS domain S-box-containing protein
MASSSAASAGGRSDFVTFQRISTQDLERKARVAELLLEAARTLGDTLDHERVYDRFHELLEHVVPHDGVVVSSYDERDGLIRAEYCWTDGARLDVSTFPPLPLNRSGGGMQSRVIVSGEAIVFNDVAEVVKQPGGTFYDVDREGTFRKLPDEGPPPTRAAMMAPVKHEGKVVGVIQVMTSQTEFSAEQLEIMEGLVALLGAADRNARLHAERRRLEAAEQTALAVAAERERAASVAEAVGEGIFLVDPEHRIRFWNRAAALITGSPAEEVVDRPATETFPDWDTVAELIPVAEHGKAARSTTLPVTAGGWDHWLSFVAVQGLTGVVYAFRDVTGERALDEQKSDLIATISHELRTPMAAVYGAAQTLLCHGDALEEEKRRDLLEMIAAQSLRLSQTTDDILLATRLERGTVTIETQPVDVGELARATVGAMGLDADVAVEGRGRAVGSADRIQQVLVNLLDNAVKYGGPPIDVRVEPAGEETRILVRDRGPGIPTAEQRLVFERFYRSGPALTRSPGGTGLGLYISRELVLRMGGCISVRSQPGAGATFVIELPRA